MAKFEAIDIAKPIENGVVSFKVLEWDERVSKSGDDVAVVSLLCKDAKGASKEIKDTFLLENPYKLGVFAKAIGEYAQYQSGVMGDEHVVGKNGKCRIHRREFEAEDGKRTVVAIKEYIYKG